MVMEGKQRKSESEDKSETTLMTDEFITIGPEGVEAAAPLKLWGRTLA